MNDLKYRIGLEQLLDTINFYNIGCGSILAYELMTLSCSAIGISENITFREKTSIFFRKRICYPNLNKQNSYLIDAPLWVPTNFTSRFVEIYMPFVRYNFCLIHNVFTYRKKGIYISKLLTIAEFRIWKREYNKCIDKFQRILQIEVSKGNLSLAFADRLTMRFLIKSQQIIKIDKKFEELTPQFVLTDYDRQNFNSLVILSAKKHSVKTYTLIHGSTEPPNNFVPFLADTIFAWGQRQKDLFAPYLRAQSIEIVGRPEMREEREGSIRYLELDKIPKLLIFTNPGSSDPAKYVRSCLSALRQHQVEIYLKPHPVESSMDYQRKFQHAKNLLVLDSSIPAKIAISKCDMVIIHESTVVFEVIRHHKPILFYNPLKENDIINLTKLISDFTSLPLIEEEELLSQEMNALADNREIYLNRILSQRKFVEWYIKDAGENSVESIMDICLNRKNNEQE